MLFVSRAALLFSAGCAIAQVQYLLSRERNIATAPGIIDTYTPSWYLVCMGASSVLVGFTFSSLSSQWQTPPEWPSAIRCIALFMGMILACAKFPVENQQQEMTVALSLIALYLWYLVDRTLFGLLASTFVAAVGTVCAQGISASGFYEWQSPDLFLVRSWILPMLFSATITFGSLGRRLAVA